MKTGERSFEEKDREKNIKWSRKGKKKHTLEEKVDKEIPNGQSQVSREWEKEMDECNQGDVEKKVRVERDRVI